MQAMSSVPEMPVDSNSEPRTLSKSEFDTTKPTATTTTMTSATATPTPPTKDTSNSVLMNTFVIRKKQYCVRLSDGQFVWQRLKSSESCTKVAVENIIAVEPKVTNSLVPELQPQYKVQQPLSDQSTATTFGSKDAEKPLTIKQFTICYAKRMENSSNPNKWRYFTQTFQNSDSQVCQLWIEAIQRQIDDLVRRPKRLLLFVNPYGGKKRALRIYDGTVKPILQMAGIDASVVISQRSNQIRDFIMTQSLEHFDGIVCIGGDGTFSELFNGIIFRSFKDLDWTDFTNLDEIPKILEKPLGIIPAGSTDTVAYCLNGTCDVCTIVLNIVLGQVNGMDLASVSNQNGLIKFYASVMSYGFLGDVCVESEKYRWMGPARYDYSGFKKLLRNRGYDGEISLLIDPTSTNDPLKGPACLENCAVCTPPEVNNHTKQAMTMTTTTKTQQTNQPVAVIQNNTTETFSDKCNDNNNEPVENVEPSDTVDRANIEANNETQLAHDNIHIDIQVECMKSPIETAADDASGQDFVKTINGKFFMVNGANISCACPRSPNGFSKYCHLCDGYIDLILVRHTTFLNNLRLLLAMSSRNCRITDLNHVEIYRTKRFSFKPNGMQTGASSFNLHSSRVPISIVSESNHASAWNCDGEVVYDSDVSIRSHRHLINVYRRELFNAQKETKIDDNQEAGCCC